MSRGLLALALALALVGCGGVSSDELDPPSPASDALAALTVTRGTLEPPFDPAVTDYTLTLSLGASSLGVTATAQAPEATSINISGTEVPSGGMAALTLDLGDNHVDVAVRPDGGAPRTYTLLVRRGPGIAEQATLVASNANSADNFGRGVALSGDTLAIGANLEESGATGINGDQGDDSAPASGAVYVFVRTGDAWSQQAYIKASNAAAGDGFGSDVALDGDTLAVGAPFEDSAARGVDGAQDDDTATNSGAVYVFTRSGTAWSQQAYIKASNADISDELGTSVAVAGDTIVAGAPNEDSGSTGVNGDEDNRDIPGSGAAYVFTRSGTTWSQQAYIKASNPDSSDVFGSNVAIDNDTIAVGVPLEDSAATGVGGDQSDNSATTSGAVYVFTRTGTSWSQQAYLKGAGKLGDRFGDDVGISGDTLVAGASSDDILGLDAGVAHVFVRSGSSWFEQAVLVSSSTTGGDRFGKRVDIAGDVIVVGSPFAASGGVLESGSATVFVRGGAEWPEQALLEASDAAAGDRFGRVAIDGATVAVGANARSAGAGAVLVFE